jgi:hypothetical protein
VVTSRALEALESDGAYRHIHGIVVDGVEPVHDFLGGLRDPDLSDFMSRFDKLDESGLLQAKPWRQMGNWFKPLHHVGNVWQVSATSHRLLGFRSGDTLVLTNGFYKTGGETPPKQIKKAENLRKQFESER